MATELKTKPTSVPPRDFIAGVENATRRADAETALALHEEITGEPAVMWGPSIVGFGAYTYVNTTKKPATWPIAGFSPRKAEMVVYLMADFPGKTELLARLGKHRVGVSCLYIKKFADVDMAVLRELIDRSARTMRAKYPA
jgi:hypothetical protein